MNVAHYLMVATALPLVGFLLMILFGKRMRNVAGALGSVLMLAAFGCSVAALVGWVSKPEFNRAHYAEAQTMTWLPLPSSPLPSLPNASGAGGALLDPGAAVLTDSVGGGTGSVQVGVLVDTLTVAMFVMVTLVALLVHLFSITYMAEDPRVGRYFAYLGLFCFSMLGLILSNSLVQIFVFWELVGICSYLLIGFWYERRGPAMASIKAVLVNRVGDAAFLVGMGLLAMHVGTNGLTLFDANGASLLGEGVRNALNVRASEFMFFTSNGGFLGLHWLTWAGLCLFAGAAAKAAQFPFQVWLPDAMEGPSPISALIHAATMVAAGVYLVARIYPILTMDARLVIAVIGCVTLTMGALIALVQTDIKRVLAYSTISQLGYMMLFLGAGGYVAGLLHLFTHAFFKACLFLAAGSVIHALHHEQDLREMGGLWKKMPITALAFLVGTLALIGVPLFSGAYSKELGLSGVYVYASGLATLAKGHAWYGMLLYWVPVGVTYLTAFYMGRCWWLAFGGKSRNEEMAEGAHESALMTLPMIVLMVLSVGAWFEFFGFARWIGKSIPLGVVTLSGEAGGAYVDPELVTTIGGHVFTWATLGWTGAIVAVVVYFAGFGIARRISKTPGVSLLYAWLRERMFFDALYRGVLGSGVLMVSRVMNGVDRFVVEGAVGSVVLTTRMVSRLSAVMDAEAVDGTVRGLSLLARRAGHGALATQSGRIRMYVLAMVTILLVTGWVCVALFAWKR